MLLRSAPRAGRVPPEPQGAAALPAMSAASGKLLTASGNIYLTGISLPAGDWSVGGHFRLNAADTAGDGYIFALFVSGGSGPTSRKVCLVHDRTTGRLHMTGNDDAGNGLGSYKALPAGGTTQEALISEYMIPPETDMYVVCQKSGTKAQLWIKFNGHAPVLAAEEETLFGATAAQRFRFGGIQSGNGMAGRYRNWHKLSYALTRDQIDKIANGELVPTGLGTPAADDFYFPMDGASNRVLTSTINGLTTVDTTVDRMTTVTGLGYAPIAQGVFLDPVGPDGFVVQQQNGQATVSLSGTYQGGHGAAIQAQVVAADNTTVLSPWQTVATAAGGNVWAGSITVPKGKRWLKVQLRKNTSPNEVTTTTVRWGVGENVILAGQSLTYYLGETGGSYGTADVAANGFVSFQSSIPVYVGGDEERLVITGAANSGGLIEITTSSKHGQRTGSRVVITGVGGTTEANDQVWTITATSPTKFTLNGSTFANAYTSGGTAVVGKHVWRIPGSEAIPAGNTIVANAVSNMADAVVCVINRAVAGSAINQNYQWTSVPAPYMVLAARAARRVGAVLWAQGHSDQGLNPLRQYYADGGTSGAWTGWGRLGTLLDFYKANFPNSDFDFGVVPFHTISGSAQKSAQEMQDFRWGMLDWALRKIAAGETKVFPLGFQHDFEPQFENNVQAHLIPDFKGTKSMAARMGHDLGVRRAGSGNDSFGPKILSASRSGAVVDLTVQHNGGTSLRTLTTGARASGFEVASDTAFTSKLAISAIQIVNATTVRLTLASNPGAAVYVRYMFGRVGDYPQNVYGTPRISGVADNGAGLIRVTTSTTPGVFTPTTSQKAGGHGLVTGQWVRIEGVRGATQANGEWEVNVIDSQNFDLVGSSSAGMGTFQTGSIWSPSNASAVASVEVGIPIYDNRTIGGADANGAPLQPTFTYLTAA